MEISQDSRKNSLSMSDIGSCGEDSLGLVEEKIIDPLALIDRLSKRLILVDNYS